jgi:hypothetical protein
MTIDLQNRQNLPSPSRIFASILQVRQAASHSTKQSKDDCQVAGYAHSKLLFSFFHRQQNHLHAALADEAAALSILLGATPVP